MSTDYILLYNFKVNVTVHLGTDVSKGLKILMVVPGFDAAMVALMSASIIWK